MAREYTEIESKQIERLKAAGIVLEVDINVEDYLAMEDDLGEFKEGMDIPAGFKKCGHCNHILKLYMFNVNNAAKNKCTGNCKKCQKASAADSYTRTKGNRNYKQYYQDHKEQKQAQGKKHYQNNKDDILKKQKDYHSSKQGKKVMKKAHKKRRKLIAGNKGIPYKREYVIDRDKCGGENPICYLCGLPITVDRNLHLDHVVPIVLGGADCFTNVACTHELCNLQKKKDATDIKADQVEMIIERAENYIDEHPELFETEKV